MKFRNTKYLIGAVFILLGIGIILATALPKSLQYYVTVDELMAKESQYLGKTLKVAGTVEPGSVEPGADSMTHRFRVANAGKIVSVTFRGGLPDTFKEGIDVVVTGKYTSEGTMVATEVLAKCASRYEDRLKRGYQPESK
ncbi:MAG: cytochrome c maturation protein CcmE [Pseudomonadota bacterium]